MADASSWMLYGSYGFTGELIADEAVARGKRPLLAGRDRRRLEAQARELGLEACPFALDDAPALRSALARVRAVVHAAGPFADTAAPMVDACLETGTHYLDITGEVDVFESIYARDAEARAADVVLLPGVGFDVVPTDCAAARAAAGVREAVAIDLAWLASGGPSRGTARTMLRGAGRPGRIRRDGRLVDVPIGAVRREIPFSDRTRAGVAIPWGDLASAPRSTGARDVRVFLASSSGLGGGLGALGPLLRTSPGRWLADRLVSWRVSGPDTVELAEGGTRVWCEARGAAGEATTVELTTPNGYALTADASVSAVIRILEGRSESRSGALTPVQAFGAGFVDELRGVQWVAATGASASA